ncbi:MAG: efflux RND transporter periplasmic adaptor subunit [Myxococcota bacterium]
MILALSLAVTVWLGVRIQSAISQREKLAAERQAAALAAAGKGEATRAVSLVSPKAESWIPTVRFEGSLGPSRAADLAFKVGGRLGQIRVKNGMNVDKGTVLAVLDADEARAQQQAAAAQVRAAEAQLRLAEDADGRMSKAAKGGAMSEMTVNQAKSQAQLAAAQLDAAKAQLLLATVNLDNHTLNAPFPGLITRAPTAVGTILGPGVPQFRLEDIQTLKLSGTLNPDEAALVNVGALVHFELDGRPIDGVVTVLLPSLDPMTRRVPVEAEVKNDPKAPIRAGAFVRARAEGKNAVTVLRLPPAALRPGSQDVVMIAEAGKMRERRVVFATAAEGDLLVRSGIAAEDRIILSPAAEAHDGDPLVTSVEAKP